MTEYGAVMLAITELVVTILAFLFAGRFLDSHFHTGSLYMTIGAIGGLIIGVVRLTIRLKGVMNGSDDQS